MNILVLTPDRVGSSLLQRVLTVYMNNSNDVPKPVVNVHELCNGIKEYHSDDYNEILLAEGGMDERWQSLSLITDKLKKVPHHSIVCRLAHYHIVRRNDSMYEQLNLYEYLNDNYFIIACRRNSVFEYALSWGIQSYSKKLNAYTAQEKIEKFGSIYKNPITIPKENMLKALNAYDAYIKWADTHFHTNRYYVYEEDMPQIETFVHGLECFNDKQIPKWEDIYGMKFQDWNKCHRLVSDIGITQETKLLEDSSSYEKHLPSTIVEIISKLPKQEQEFVKKHQKEYFESQQNIKKMVEDKILVQGIPIKLQTLVEKKLMISNFNECAMIYNEWAAENGYDVIKDNQEIIDSARDELKLWYQELPSNLLGN